MFPSLSPAVPPPSALPPPFSVPSSVPGLGSMPGVAAAVVPAVAPALFRPFAVTVSSEPPVVSSAPASFTSAPLLPPSAAPSGLLPRFPHASASSAPFA